MGIFNNCLLACDIDGTLVENGYINPKNIEKINYFISEGGNFALSTGRSAIAFSDVLKALPIIKYAITLNGAVIYNYDKSEVIYEKIIDKDDYYIVNEAINSDINFGIEIHTPDKVFTLKRTDKTTLHQEYEKFSSPDITFEEVCKYSWNKVLYVFDSAEEREAIKPFLNKENLNCSFIDTSAVIDNEFQSYYEQLPLGVSKAMGINHLCEVLNIEKGKNFAIGDYFNDIEMLENADISAVPIDSPDEIKNRADYITISCKDGAVADFIDYLKSKFYTE